MTAAGFIHIWTTRKGSNFWSRLNYIIDVIWTWQFSMVYQPDNNEWSFSATHFTLIVLEYKEEDNRLD